MNKFLLALTASLFVAGLAASAAQAAPVMVLFEEWTNNS